MVHLHTSTPGSPRGSSADSASAKLPISKHANANKYRSCADFVPTHYKKNRDELIKLGKLYGASSCNMLPTL